MNSISYPVICSPNSSVLYLSSGIGTDEQIFPKYLHQSAHSTPSSNLLCFLDSVQIRAVSTDHSALTLVPLHRLCKSFLFRVRMMHVLRCFPGIRNELVKQILRPSFCSTSSSAIRTLSMTGLRNPPVRRSEKDAEQSVTFWKVFRGRIGIAWS
jgi:hypothetical protein